MTNDRGPLYFCLGCAAGVAGAMLVYSKTGRETITSLRGKVDQGVNSVGESVKNLSGAVNNAAAHVVKSARHHNAALRRREGRLSGSEKATP
jgi:hypothetical protein